VNDVTALHSVFVTPAILEKRPPLAPTARRAGWIGCNLLLSRVPPEGQISLVCDGVATSKAEARRLYAQSKRLEELKPKERGWIALVLAFVRRIGKEHFTIKDLLLFEKEMHAIYPNNSHIREKIRQQLQVLIRLGYLDRTSPGEFRVLLS
jgi:type II restriction enzyme